MATSQELVMEAETRLAQQREREQAEKDLAKAEEEAASEKRLIEADERMEAEKNDSRARRSWSPRP
jgi:hypothetical protein